MKKEFLWLSAAIFIISCDPSADKSDTKQNPSESMREYYSEQHRPQFHFSPESMWMNDPNGMVYYDGEYHLFYQYYPEDIVWGPMHWGHAVSTDMVHWEHLPIALYPDELGYIFSGSAVIDWNNTSGFGSKNNPPLIAIFTYHNIDGERAGKNDYQTQGIAYSTDKGRNWTKYENNPVLPNPGIRDFRDPKVMWYEAGNKWIMTFAAQDQVRFYSSTNLKEWAFESEFGKGIGAQSGVWECPDLFPMQVDGKEKWVLLVSIIPGGTNGGSATQYFTGNFDGKNFVNDNPPETILWMDWGKDNYAGVTWSDIPEKDGRRLFLGWMSNWQYAEQVPTTPWRSAMTIPRTLELKNSDAGMRLISNPVVELKKLRSGEFALEPGMISGNKKVNIGEASKKLVGELEVAFQMRNGSQFGLASEFGIELSNGRGEKVLIGFELAEKRFFIDRSQSGKVNFSPEFPGRHYGDSVPGSDTVKMHLFIDVASVELFADDGHTVMTEIFFPNEDFNKIVLYTKNGSVQLKEGKYYSYRSIWD